METKKVLIIDDEKHWRNLFRAFLQDYNFEISEAIVAKTGFAQAKRLQPDIIILDNKMPDMTGLEAAKLFRRDPVTKKIPIIMATAMAFSDNMVDYIKMDVHDFIKKPFEVKELLEKIQKLIGTVRHKAEFTTEFTKKTKVLTCFSKKINSEFIQNRLKNEKYEISEAKDSADLLQKIIKEKPEIIVTGAENAGWSGYAGIKLLQNSQMKNIPIILDMADTDSEEMKEIVANTGNRYFLLQPIKTEEMAEKLGKLGKLGKNMELM